MTIHLNDSWQSWSKWEIIKQLKYKILTHMVTVSVPPLAREEIVVEFTGTELDTSLA